MDILNLVSDIGMIVVMFLIGIVSGIFYTNAKLQKAKVIETKQGTYTFTPKNPILGEDNN